MATVARSIALLLLLATASPLLGNELDDSVGEDGFSLSQPNPPPPPGSRGSSTGRSCIFKAPEGQSFDLTPMKHLDHDYTGTTNGGYAYRFNVCGNTVKMCNAQPAPASKWRGTKCNNLGDPSTQTVSLLDAADPSKGLRVEYTQGDICKRQVDGQMEISSRAVSYEITCDPGESPGALRLIKEVSMCEYVIQFASKHACPAGMAGGMLGGHGWRYVFLILFGAAAYLGVGIYLNGRQEGKHGIEAIPHIRYWEEVPGLVRDGMMFSYVTARPLAETGIEKGKVLYETLKERYQNQYAAPPG